MKRLARQSLVAALAIALVVAAIAAAGWVVATTQGARWLLTNALPLSGAGFSVQKIEGRIIDRLLLRGVRVTLAQQKLNIDSLELRWKPLLLLAGTVAVRELKINGVRIQDNTAVDNKPPNLAWPKVSETGQLFDGMISRLLVTELSYRRLQQPPLLITSFKGTVSWQGGLLTIIDLDAAAPSGRIKGSISAGFRQPSLTSDLAIVLAQPLADMDRFTLQVRKAKGTGLEQFVANLTIAGSVGARKLLELNGDVGMARDAFNLRRLLLTSPGRKGRISADGKLAFTALEPLLSLQVKAENLDLAPELNVPTDLSGTVNFAGTLNSYRGDMSLANKAEGWRAAAVSASYAGTGAGMKLAPLNGKLLDGTLAGNLDLNWRNGFSMQGAISGRNLNPARIDPGWKGLANFNATGRLDRAGQAPLTGSVSGSLLESRLHGQALTGELKAGFSGDNLTISRLALQGKGFDLQASGELKQRINLTARISDFSRLVPGSAGTLRADGWVSWNDGKPAGALVATGSKLAYSGTHVAAANLTARLEAGAGYPVHLSASFKNVVHDGYALDSVTLAADGTLPRHGLKVALRSGSSDARLALNAGYNDGLWKGEIGSLSGRDSSGPWNMTAPAAFAVSAGKFSLSNLSLSAGAGERLELSADLVLKPLGGQVRAQWSALDLSRANRYLKDMKFSGNSHGKVRLDLPGEKRLALAGNAAASGTFAGQGTTVSFRNSTLTFDGNEQGLRAALELNTADGGRLKGSFASSAPFRLALPENGKLTADLSGIDLALFKPWLPPDTVLEGRISGRAKGAMLPGQRFELNGNAALSGGMIHQQRPDGELKLDFSTATASWVWRGETLSGDFSLVMADHGQAGGTFQLPLPARFPLAINPKGALKASLSGQVREKGIITALFPGLVHESSGELDARLVAGGTWEVPTIGGKLQLSRAGAYLPTAGIHLRDVQLAARLEKNLIRIDSYRALSGTGHIEGTALIKLDGWRVTGYQGSIEGENFQTVDFPELKILATPKLSFEGTPQKLTVRGELILPELRIVGAQSGTVVTPSSDVIREGRAVQPAAVSPLALDVQVRVLLGDRVFVKVAGIDAQLGGALNLSLSSLDNITSKGEIKVIKGRYRTYGVNLEIVRGRLFFAGGAINRPSIDVLALRSIGDIRAGVTVTGTLQRPITRLYSEPAMPDVDVLAYIVLGHPLGSSGEQVSLLTQAAGALLRSGQAAVLQEQIKNYLGLSTLEIQGGVGGTNSAMGYKPLQVTPPGALPATQQPGITETVLTVGKYLTPQLYFSYGKSLFTGNSIFRLRYDFYKNWQIETQTGGGESGADLYYKLEFK